MTHSTITLEVRGIEVEVEATATILTGGSNSYGSDEPEWVEVEDIDLWHPTRARRLSPALHKLIMDEYESYIGDVLIEQH